MKAKARAGAPVLGAILLGALSVAAGGQERSRTNAPFVRVSTWGDGAVESNYVEPAIDVNEDVYVFAVAMDLDGRIQVLHPDFPGISVKLRARHQLHLQNFFAGFLQPGMSDSYGYGYAGYSRSAYSEDMTRGVIIALASRQPFNLELLESNGDWNNSQIRQLIDNRSPALAAENLAHYIGARGEPIGRDYARFAGGNRGSYAYPDIYAACDYYYGSGYSSYARLQAFNSILFLRQRGQQVNIVGYNLCGMPIVAYGPTINNRFAFPRTPRGTGDTTVFPKSRIPRSSAFPRERTSERAAYGAFPRTRRREPTQIGDVRITAPATAGRDPRQVFEELRAQGGSDYFPSGRLPSASGQQARGDGTLTTQALHDLRPEPRVSPSNASAGSASSFPIERSRSGSSGETAPRVIHESPPPATHYSPPPAPSRVTPSSSPPPSPPAAQSPPPRKQ